MASVLKKIFRIPEPVGSPKTIKHFETSDSALSSEVVIEAESWRIDPQDRATVLMFEIRNPGVHQSMLTYRAKLKSQNLEGGVNLEMCCHMPGTGEFTTKGINKNIRGSSDWQEDEIPLHLKKGQQPEKIELKVSTEGPGTVWIKNMELVQTPMNM
jgi:hypothetical protein